MDETTNGTDLTFSTILLDYAVTGNSGTSKNKKTRVDNLVRELMDLMGQDILPAFGANAYLMRLRKPLENPSLIDDSLNQAISSMCRSVITHPELLGELAPSGALKAGIECINRQALKGKPGNQSDSLGNYLGMYTYAVNDSCMSLPTANPR